MTTPIPQPPTIPFLGNAADVDKDLPMRSWALLSQKYGEIFQLNMINRTAVFVTSHALVNEMSDDKRFPKGMSKALLQLRNLLGDSLFTACGDEPNWAVAHRLLMPAFGPVAVRGMLEDMRDICSQLLLKWERFGPQNAIDIVEDYTKLALDTIALCSMSHRMNNFYTEGQPEFVRAIIDFLRESSFRTLRPSIVQALSYSANAKYEEDMKIIVDIANKIIADRRQNPMDKKDILQTMLYERDLKTGQRLSDDSIVKNLVTFLIAGHETTSAALSFATYYLVKYPEVMRKLRAEVDEVIGGRPPVFDDFSKMPYLTAILRETLRLHAVASARTVVPTEDQTLKDGKYTIKAGTTCVILNYLANRDRAVWGEDVEEFCPERMMDGKFEALPPNAWQPFGYGMRSCIGRIFAWQEMQLVLSSIVQRFDLFLVDPSYTIDIRQTLTIKPKDLHIRAVPRTSRHFEPTPSSGLKAEALGLNPVSSVPVNMTESIAELKHPVYIFYGSNTGTSEAFAQRIASDAPSHGFRPSLGTLDSATEHLPTDGPVVMVTASFEGQPADNATRFYDWLCHLKNNELDGVQFAVFGCGNSDWVQSYQRIPRTCDKLLGERGANRLLPLGVGDARDSSFFPVFDAFEANLWKTLQEKYGTTTSKVTTGLTMKIVDVGTSRAATLRQSDAAMGIVVQNRLLTNPFVPQKRHIEFELPKGMTAQAGDYLSIIPRNPPRDIHRVLARFGLSDDQEVILSSAGPTSLPVGKVINVSTLVGGYVELCQAATTRDIHALSDATETPEVKAELEHLLESYNESVLANKISVLDLLEKYKDIEFPFERFLSLLPTMRVRQYSISSSPLWNPEHVTLTISVVTGPSTSGREEPFLGVASNFLANLRLGDKVQMAIRTSSAAFHLPSDVSIPVVMFCAGSGLAPMRGFIQERAIQKQSGRAVGPMTLFFGCRSSDGDYLYSQDDLAEWVKLGVVDVRPAFSRQSEDSEGCKYIQDRVWHDQDDIRKAFNADARFYTCGSRNVASGIKDKLVEIIKTSLHVDNQAALEKFDFIMAGRYATDIFD